MGPSPEIIESLSYLKFWSNNYYGGIAGWIWLIIDSLLSAIWLIIDSFMILTKLGA
jgi:hypothetical protein